jgi:hypothetical protein
MIPVKKTMGLGVLGGHVSLDRLATTTGATPNTPRLGGGRAPGPDGLHWAWSGVAYHALFFSGIDPAARPVAAPFVVQAAAFAWRTWPAAASGSTGPFGSPCARRAARLRARLPGSRASHGPRLAAHPHVWGTVPHDAVHHGLLLATAPPVPRWLVIMLVLWRLVGGPAGLLLGVVPDLMLFVAGVGLVMYAVAPDVLDRPSAQ